jgi:hypothetical protein
MAIFFYYVHIKNKVMRNNLNGPTWTGTIDTNNKEAMEYWTYYFGISEPELRKVVERVGVQAMDIIKELEPIRRVVLN